MVQATYIVQGMLSVPQAFTNVGWAKSKINAAAGNLPACSRHGAVLGTAVFLQVGTPLGSTPKNG